MFRYLDDVFTPIQQVDPAKIRVIAEYELSTLLYSPLIEYSSEGRLVGNIAEKFYWDGNDLVFEIAKDLRSSKGDLITAEDVEFSLKRLFVLSTNSHGDLQNILCHGHLLKNIHDSCPGIVSEGHEVRLKFDQKRHYLIPMLASIDFAIIPKKAVNLTDLSISDYENGSGPYRFISQDAKNEQTIIEARPEHIRYNPRMPQLVEIKVWKKPSGEGFTSEERVGLLEQGLVDFIPTNSFPDQEAAFKLVNKSDEVRMFKTMNIGLCVLVFTEKGKRRFSVEQRLAVGSEIRKRFADFYAGNQLGRISTMEYFPPMGAGHLNQEDIENLKTFLADKAIWTGKDRMKVSITTSAFELTKKIVGESDKFELISAPSNPLFRQTDEPDFPDAHISVTDVSFNEDFNLLAYTEALKVFPYDEGENKKWLNSYMKEEDETVRLELMRKLHLDILKAGNIIPLSSMPYIALSRKPWSMKFSKLFAGSSLWQMEIDN